MTEGDDLADALAMTEDYIGSFSLESALPDSVSAIPAHQPDQLVRFVRVNVSEYQCKNDNRTKKTSE